MTNLVIVGNGFDLLHGLKTRYLDFKDYLAEKDDQLIYSLERFIPFDDLWSDFEENLGHVDLAEVAKHFALENDDPALHQPINNRSSDDAANSIAREYERTVEKFTDGLREHLKDFILSLPSPSQGKILNCIDETDELISFNYTKTVEKIYGIESEYSYFIHNTAIDPNAIEGYINYSVEYCQNMDSSSIESQGIIFGHGLRNKAMPELPEPAGSITVDYDISRAYSIILGGYEHLKEYYQRSAKHVQTNLSDLKAFLKKIDVDKVYIIGHSLSSVDLDYFIEIGKHFPASTEYHISYYGKDNKKDIESSVRRFIIKPNNVIYHDLSDSHCALYSTNT